MRRFVTRSHAISGLEMGQSGYANMILCSVPVVRLKFPELIVPVVGSSRPIPKTGHHKRMPDVPFLTIKCRSRVTSRKCQRWSGSAGREVLHPSSRRSR